MSSAPEPGPEPRRSFTDVASLFQPIVPPPGTPVREQPEPPPLPPTAELTVHPVAEEPQAATAPDTLAAPPSGPAATPFPDAWAPKPNWRPPRSWSWLLLVPLGLLGAGIMLTANPAAMRKWVQEHVWAPRPAPVPAVTAEAPRPAPAPPIPAGSAPEAAPEPPPPAPALATQPPPAAPAVAEPTPPASAQVSAEPGPATPPAPAAAEPQAPAPLTPTPPPAAPAQPASAQPPPAPAAPAAAAAPSFGAVAIRYRRGQDAGQAEAARLAAQLQPLAEHVETRPVTTGYRAPTILYFRPEDRPAALSLAQTLAAPGAAWSVRSGKTRQRPGALEVWLP